MIRRVRGRAIVVLEERPYLGAGPAEIGAVWDRCEPWPWLLAGTTAALPDGLAERLAARPVPVDWLGAPPPGLPPHAVAHESWLALAERLAGLAGRAVGGVRLARNRGLRAPDGRTVLDAPGLEGLMAAPDGGLAGLDEAAVAAELAAARLPLALSRDGGRLRLVPA